MVKFRIFQANGLPLSSRQVIVRVPGRFEYGITDASGFVSLPLANSDQGRIIIGGRTVYLGDLGITHLVLN